MVLAKIMPIANVNRIVFVNHQSLSNYTTFSQIKSRVPVPLKIHVNTIVSHVEGSFYNVIHKANLWKIVKTNYYNAFMLWQNCWCFQL